MNRELKFRVWSKQGNYWLYHNKTVIINYEENLWLSGVMQFTGTKDADGKDIYEGDIVRHIYREMDDLAIVCYDNEEALYYLEELNDSGWVDAWHDTRRWYRLAIVGNPYENPELLTG